MPRKLLPFGVLLLAFALRLIALNTRPLWYDEAFAVLFAEKGFQAMLTGTLTPVEGAASDVHPIAYYTTLNGWMQIFGQSPFAVRLLSVFLGLLTVAVAYGIGRRLLGGRAAIAGMAVAAVSPFHVYYSQETRMYAALTLFCALTILFFLRATIGDRRYAIRNWLGLAVSAALAMYMQNLAAFFLLAFGLSTLPRPKVFAKVAVAGAVAFVLWLPWFLNLPGQFAKLQQAYWVTRPDFVTLLQTAMVYHAGEELVVRGGQPQGGQLQGGQPQGGQPQGGQPQGLPLLGLALFTAIVLPLMLVWRASPPNPLSRKQRAFSGEGEHSSPSHELRSCEPRPTGASRSLGERDSPSPEQCFSVQERGRGGEAVLWLVALAFGTPLLLFLASLYQPLYIQRALLPASLMYSIALGWLLAEAAMPALIRAVLGGLLAVTSIAGLWAHYTFAQFPRPDFPAAVAFLQQNAAPGDAILHSNKLTFFPMYYYDRALPQTFLADPPGSGSDTLALPTQKVLGLFAVNDVEAAAQGMGRVWFIIFERAVEEYAPEPHPHLAWLERNYAARGVHHFDDLVVYEFVK